jgi:hypothetical protein
MEEMSFAEQRALPIFEGLEDWEVRLICHPESLRIGRKIDADISWINIYRDMEGLNHFYGVERDTGKFRCLMAL